ncbi:MAG: patatin-like phospholipase family protein [Thermoanaerobaculia bacterium]
MIGPNARAPGALTLLLSCLLTSGPAGGAEPAAAPSTPRPRICLALSGGGAVGLAHVGVLRALEELQVPIDCVAGTSMGAIVGGLYAAGYSPAELEGIVRDLDWGELLRDAPDRRRLPFRRKVDDQNYLTRWELGVGKGGIKTPSGLVVGHRLGARLHVLALRAGGVTDFDLLARPFRAIATDAGTGDTVVLASGDLGVALRASMAIPGLFSPVEIDGRLLVDGGVVDNLPVDAARAMGADLVIAVDLDQPFSTRDRPNSIAAILNRSLSVLSRREVERALADADLVLRPRVRDYGLLDFEAAATLIERGAAEVAAKADELRRLALDGEEWRRFAAERQRPRPEFEIRTVAVDPGPGLAPAVVERSVKTRPGRVLDHGLLSDDLDRLWNLGEFEKVDFSLESDGDDAWDLYLTGERKSWGPNFLRFGVALASDLEGASSFNVLTSLTMTRLNPLGAELKFALQAGEQTALAVELYQPLSKSGLPFVSLGFQAGPTKLQVPLDDDLVQYRFVDLRSAFDLGLSLRHWGELRVGAYYNHLTGRPTDRHGGDLPQYEATDAGYRARLTIDQLDRVNFPRHGVLAIGEYYDSSAGLGADEEYRRLDLQSVSAATRGRHTILGIVAATSALGGTLPERERVRLGGLFSLSGLPFGEVSGNYGGTAALVYTYRLGRAPHFADGIYAGLSLETGNAWERSADVDLGDLRRSFALVFGIDTLLGPVYLAQGWTTGGKDSLYLYVGRTF